MRNHDLRIKKLEELLSPIQKVVLIIDHTTSQPDSSIEINGRKDKIPPGADVKEIIERKIKGCNEIVTVHIAKDINQISVPDLSGLLSKDDLLLIIREFGDDTKIEEKRI